MIIDEMKEIALFNRDGKHIFIKQLENNEIFITYQLMGSKPDDLDYIRVGYEEDGKTIKYIDPSGGPFICVDSFYLMSTKIPLTEITWDSETNKIILKFDNTLKD